MMLLHVLGLSGGFLQQETFETLVKKSHSVIFTGLW